jgi:hypothetical protein
MRSFERCCWGKMEKISWTDRIKKEEIQNVPLKIGPLARRTRERILFRLVSGRLIAHSYRRGWE